MHTSDAFTITVPLISVLSPTGTSNWLVGSSQFITWDDNISDNVGIALYNGSAPVLTISPSTESDGSYYWTIPSGITTGNNYYIRVSRASNSNLYGSSSKFTISNLPCSSPASLISSSITQNSVYLEWTTISDATYQVRYKPTTSSTWTTQTTTNSYYSVSGLSCGTAYDWEVMSDCGGGSNSSWIAGTVFTTNTCTCNPPSGLSSSLITQNSVYLEWTTISGATYQVRYKPTTSSTWTTQTTPNSYYSVSGLSCGIAYDWEVMSDCGGGSNSSWIAGTDFTTNTCTCNPPSGLSSSSITQNSVYLEWTTISGATYQVRYKPTTSSTWTTQTTPNSYYSVSGLSCGIAYDWEVMSDCGGGSNSSWIAGTVFTTNTCTCNPPSGLSSSSITQNSVYLEWTTISDATYQVRYKPTTSSTWTTQTTTNSYYSVSGLSCGTAYDWEVMSDCGGGSNSSWIAGTDFTTNTCPCNPPSGLSSSSITQNSVYLEWTTISDATYQVRYKPTTSSTWTTQTTTNSYYSVSGLSCGTAYDWEVMSDCGGGSNSSWIAGTDFTTNTCPCNPPSGLSSSSITQNSVYLEWTTISDATYQVRYKPTTSSTWTTQTTTNSYYSVSGLSCGTAYDWEVMSDCGGGSNSSWIAGTDFTTNTCPCNSPSGLSSSSITQNSVYLEWTTISDATYQVRYKPTTGSTWTTQSTSNSYYSATGLSCGVSYGWEVRSDCGSSNYSSWVSGNEFELNNCIDNYLIINQSEFNVSPQSGTIDIGVDANVEWSVVEAENWLDATKINETIFTVDYDENTEESSRSAEITVSGDGVSSQIITIIQAGISVNAIYEIFENSIITIYPNPASDKFYIKSNSDIKHDIIISIYDNAGKLMYSDKIDELPADDVVEIDISNLTYGTYILQLNNTKSIKIKKIIKQ